MLLSVCRFLNISDNFTNNDILIESFFEFGEFNIREHFEAIKEAKNDHYLLIDDLSFIAFNKNMTERVQTDITGVKLLRHEVSPTTIPFAIMNCYFLRRSMQLKLKQMHVAGLIDFYMREFADQKYLELIEDDEGPKVFTLDQLAIGFQAVLLFLAVAAFVFLLEILLFCFKKLLKKM